MKIVVSPAKSLDISTKVPDLTYTIPEFLKQTNQIVSALQLLTPQDLSKLMGISAKLAELNYQRNANFSLPFTTKNARPAIYTFNGEVYSGLDIYTIDPKKIPVLQNKLRILSGQYGILKPLDLIQPYRLEMGTKISIGDSKNLYAFWKNTLTDTINAELQDNELFINLASTEYFSVLDTKKIKVPIITPEFKDYKNGTLKTISFFAKKARGLMLRYIIENDIQTLEELKNFNYNNYLLDSKLSTQTTLVFTR